MDRSEVEVVAGSEEFGSILSNLVVLLFQLELFGKFLHVGHLTRAGEDALVVELLDTTRLELLHHTTVRDVGIGSYHDSISVFESHNTSSNVDSALRVLQWILNQVSPCLNHYFFFYKIKINN